MRVIRKPGFKRCFLRALAVNNCIKGQVQVLDVAGNINQTQSWKKQKTRQLDFTPLGSTAISIEFLSNRFQSEKFMRPDTKATLNINLYNA